MGSFRVALDEEAVTDFATDKAQALLAYLSVEAGRPHRRDALAGLLWPDQPDQKARQSLRQALYNLRQAIGDRDPVDLVETEVEQSGPLLLVSRHTIQFNAQSDHWLDVATFTSLAEECRRHRHRRRGTCFPCLRRMERMVTLYQGEFLENFSVGDSQFFEEWVLLEREWLHREAMEALVYLADHHERRDEIGQARRYARRQVEMEPWREEAHRQLMRLLVLEGQRSAALAQYKMCRQTLAQELHVEPTDQTTALYESIRASQTAPPLLRSSAPLHDLPSPPTPFVGREEELSELADLLASPDCRLVTLVGPGGIGKTRLALQAAADQIGNFAHGVAYVSLGSLSSSELLVSAMAEGLGFAFREGVDLEGQLLNYLRQRELLLVLDGMEHILEGADLLAKMLHRAPGVIVLVTSRERLNLREEWVRDVRGLAYPEGEAMRSMALEEPADRVDALAGCEATELFRQQARRVNHRFSLSAGETPYVVRICQLVEGLPLGIELASAWAGVRSCEEIAGEIERNLDILSTTLRNVPERQRSIRATFEHSWQLLTTAEKDLLARLSVFRGPFRGEAALQVTGASLSTLLALAEKSLVRRVAPDRYDMHGLLIQFAAEKLCDSPHRCERTEMQHARYFAAFLERQSERLRLATGQDDFHELALEIENARRAWQLAVAHDCAPLIEQSLESLYLFYDGKCRFQEGVELFSWAIDRWADDIGQSHVLGKLLSRQGALYLQLCQYRQARAALERSLEIFKVLDLTAEQIFCLINLAGVARRLGDYEETGRLSARSLALSRQMGDPWGITHSLLQLGLARYREGDVDGAEALLEESLVTGQGSDNARLAISPLNVLADIACHRGDYARARALFERCLTLSRELGDQFKVAVALNNLGTVFHVLGKLEEAQSAYQESLEICRQIGDREGQAIALSNLGEVAYEAGAYADAERLYQQGLDIGRDIRDQWTVMACLNNLGEAAYALRDNDEARRFFAEALTIAQETHTLPLVLKVLVNLAALFAREGETNYAARLFGLARQHPASEQATREKARRLQDEVASLPDLVAPDAAEQSLDSVVTEVLAQLTRGTIAPSL
jgi:predicted ATPase/DNA-binding SARP family transcriptional activator/Tfp pilus assembly protein PilF